MKHTQESIAEWCRSYVATLLGTTAEKISPDASFDRLGVDSAVAVALLIEVEDRYGVDLPPEELFENPTINAVAAYLFPRVEADAA
ncbi:acyl carrier protein [Frankia sp. AgB32]|uniref:acyl carrier protein n=1 Tax=Frankia sp. AgB32 TaxID=631119 RepID=UPI00200E1BE7|nr:acyl carrier protein [Frankia sp. AgB32]MCK9893657.1 acyl carrier protein [Frankia sp. AgB32]